MTYSRPWMFLGLTLMAVGVVLLCQQQTTTTAAPPQPIKQAETKADSQAPAKADKESGKKDPSKWKDLFDGKTLTGWKVLEFGGEGEVHVKDGTIVMEMGAPMTGIRWTGEVLRNNYELTLEGMRINGSDFFCATTFPVGNDPCTLVVGGWGGSLVGLSNVDSYDASENPTTTIIQFKGNQWYHVRIRISSAAIEAWIDDEKIVDQPRKGHKFDIRSEVELCRPLGIATWYTTGAVRNLRVRPLNDDEIRAAEAQQKASAAEK